MLEANVAAVKGQAMPYSYQGSSKTAQENVTDKDQRRLTQCKTPRHLAQAHKCRNENSDLTDKAPQTVPRELC